MLAGVLGGAAIAGVSALNAPVANAEPAGRPSTPPFVGNSQMPVNVKDHGARGDGEHDDTSAIQQAIDAAHASGRTLYFPSGRYLVSDSLTLGASTRWAGDGMWDSVILRRFDRPLIEFDLPGTGPGLRVEGIAFDGDARAAALLSFENSVGFELRACRFTNFDDGGNGSRKITADMVAACELNGVGDGYFIDCLWHNPARLAGSGIAVWAHRGAGGRILSFKGSNRFLWVNDAIRVETGTKPLPGLPDRDAGYDLVDIDGAYFDGFWWLLPASHSGSGASVTFREDGLSDGSADFSQVVAGAYPTTTNIRAMPVRHTGAVGARDGYLLVDDAADFAAAGTLRGDIVRCNGAFAIIAGLSDRNPGQLAIEGWLDQETLLPTSPPEPGSTYTLYGVYIGDIVERTATSLTVDRWHDFHGNTVVPAAGTRYEVLRTRPRYHILATQGVRQLRVTNCTLRRGWADQIGANSVRAAIITGNVIEDGQDMGCTVGSQGRFQFVGNTIRHQGTASLWINGTSSVVTGNTSVSPRWKHFDTASLISHVQVRGSQYSTISHNIFDAGTESATNSFGVALMGVKSAAYPTEVTGNTVERNVMVGPSLGDVSIHGKDVKGNELIGISTPVRFFSGGTAQRIEARGQGSPTGTHSATPGSLYINEAGGSAATLWVKEAGSDADGWVAR
jgi:hypothetical protein